MADPDTPTWPLPQRLVFRFGAVYILLSSTVLVPDLPGFRWIRGLVNDAWAKIGGWTARLLHLKFATASNDDGDSTFGWLHRLDLVVLALVSAAIWSAIRREVTEHRRAHELVRVVARYWLMLNMLAYGTAKVLLIQFPKPSPGTLLEPYGDSSPMHLLWTFMGSSRSYEFFGGALECAGGLLLLSRRATTVGAALIAAVMTNVLLLNLCYDVPVKLHATEVLLMSLFLLAPALGRLTRALLEPAPTRPRWAIAVKVGLLAAYFIPSAIGLRDMYRTFGPGAQKQVGPEGAFLVEKHLIDGADAPIDRRWDVIAFGDGAMWVRQPSGAGFGVPVDSYDGDQLVLHGAAGPVPLTVAKPDDDHLVLTGDLHGVPTELDLRRLPPFTLTSRGFHWVTDLPYNR
jgi:hypothetical protein